MADWSNPGLPEQFALQFDRRAAQIRCAMPGVIQGFDPATQTASVQPALKMKVNFESETKQVDMPQVSNVPVVLPFAQGAGLLLTLPIQAGDECLLVFSDRALDNFTQSGGIQPSEQGPGAGGGIEATFTTPRAHDISDAICIPGIISNPQAVPEYNTENIELRDRERKAYISLGPNGIEITDGTASWKMSEGAVTLDSPAGITQTSEGPVTTTTSSTATIESSNMTLGGDGGTRNEINDTLTSANGTFIDSSGVNLNTHSHTGVTPGGGDTGEPVK